MLNSVEWEEESEKMSLYEEKEGDPIQERRHTCDNEFYSIGIELNKKYTVGNAVSKGLGNTRRSFNSILS